MSNILVKDLLRITENGTYISIYDITINDTIFEGRLGQCDWHRYGNYLIHSINTSGIDFGTYDMELVIVS